MSTQVPSQDAADQDLLSRLDRLKPGRPHRRLMVMGGLGYTFDSFDGALMGYALSALIIIWNIPKGTAGWLLSSIFFGYLIGALLSGVLADRLGRRRLMLSALLIFCVCSLLMGTSTSVEELFVWRALAGIGIGAETTLIAPYVAEFLPARVRGKFVARTVGFLSLGYILAGVCAPLIISPNPEIGWRIAAVVAAIPVVLLLWWRRSMPESPRYLLARGRVEEAAATIERLERECGIDPAATPAVVADVADEKDDGREPIAVHPNALGSLAGFWRGPIARTTVVLWVLWFTLTGVNYGFTTWLPTLLVTERDFTITKSFVFALFTAIAQVPGYYLASVLIDRIERKWLIAIYAIGATGAALLIALSHTEMMLLVGAALLSAFINGVAAVYYTYTAESYPTAIRATGMGAASAIGRVGAIAAPIGIGYLAAAGVSFSGTFLCLVGVLALAIVVVVLFGQRTAGTALREGVG